MAAALRWESATVKAHFRLTAQRLGQLQAKLDSHGNITRTDIATLLQQGNVGLARAKAQKLIQEDAHGDLLGILELEVSNLLEHFTELDTHAAPTPLLTEAIASIIYAAPTVHCKELDVVRSTLIQRFGPDFARAAATNNEGHVPARVLRTVNAPLPSATLLNQFLATVARRYGVNWNPDPERHDIVNYLSELLNGEITKEIDMENLRKYCVYGLPDEPSWVRPRVWKLFFGIIPPKHDEWSQEISKQRECYYDLVTRLLKPYDSIVMSSPTEAEALDEALLNIFKHISRIPRQMFSHLETAPELFSQSPLSLTADEDVKIEHAFALDDRLKVLRENDADDDSESSNPQIKISVENEPTPGIKISDHDDEDSESGESSEAQTILESKTYSFGSAHPLHCSAILRLLFIHASINPGKLSPHIPALLVPLYTALLQEVDPDDLAHVEADTFWLFEAIVSEISELDEEEGGQKWMTSFDNVVAWADPELYTDLQAKGLQPALPHYSYRWLATLLTYTLPIPALFIVWDAIFSRLPRDKDANFKLDFLVDVTSAMLIALRKPLLSLGQVTTGSLWNDEGLAPELAARELTAEGDAFLEGISMLQAYPLNTIQDAERILQIANDLINRREMERRAAAQTAQAPGFGARLRTTMWKGFTNQIDSAYDSPDSGSDREKKEDGNETERPAQGSLGFGLPSVLSSLRGSAPPVPPKDGSGQSAQPSGPSTAAAGLWNYAEKLKDSDTVANLAKMGTNWRARAVTVTGWGRGAQPTSAPASAPVVNNGQSNSPSASLSRGPDHVSSFGNGDRRDTVVNEEPNDLTSPRHFYTSPTIQQQDTGYYSSSSTSTTSSSLTPSPISPGESQNNNESLVNKTKNLLSIASKSATPASARRSPRPLLLNSASPITSPPAHVRAPSINETMRTPDSSEWSEVMKMKRQAMTANRQSISSASSLSPSEAVIKSGRSLDWDSDTASRKVPLNRRSVSPMAPAFRIGNHPQSRASISDTFTPTRSPLHSPPGSAPAPGTRSRLEPHVYSPTPRTPMESLLSESLKRVDLESVSEAPNPPKQFIASKPEEALTEDTSDSSIQPTTMARQSRVRSKKYPQRPANLQIRDTYPKGRTSLEQKTPSPSSLTVDWPGAGEDDLAVTPRASHFHDAMSEATSQRSVSPRLRRPSNARKSSADGQTDGPARKTSSSSNRSRKVSTGSKEVKRNRRDSAADEGDDEGYDDLLSAYESEDDPRPVSSK